MNQSLSPTLDNLVSTEIYGLATLERRIEYLAVDCLTLVVNLNHRSILWHRAVTLLDYLVLNT
ncbi:Uncharacterised protein [Segatella copri]|nr:Uncharacterised protein [Segatella copri]